MIDFYANVEERKGQINCYSHDSEKDFYVASTIFESISKKIRISSFRERLSPHFIQLKQLKQLKQVKQLKKQ